MYKVFQMKINVLFPNLILNIFFITLSSVVFSQNNSLCDFMTEHEGKLNYKLIKSNITSDMFFKDDCPELLLEKIEIEFKKTSDIDMLETLNYIAKYSDGYLTDMVINCLNELTICNPDVVINYVCGEGESDNLLKLIVWILSFEKDNSKFNLAINSVKYENCLSTKK